MEERPIFRIFFHPKFQEIYEDLDNRERIEVDKTLNNLRNNFTGQPLGVRWLKEKRIIDSKRLYYVSFVEIGRKILIVAYSNKKVQKKEIELLKKNKQEYVKILNSKD